MRAGLTAVDLFAGAGGLSVGLAAAGFSPLYANEVVPQYARTYQLNHPATQVCCADIRSTDPVAVRHSLGLAQGELDLLAGGPPCQGFSINAPLRSASDRRNHLFRDYLRFAQEFAPRAILIENVPGLVSFQRGATLTAILDALEALGYHADVRLLYAPFYRVPQTRWRTIILGFRDSDDIQAAFPEPVSDAPMRVNFTSQYSGRSIVHLPTNSPLKRFTSVREAICDLPTLVNGEVGAPIKHYSSLPQCDYQRLLRAGSRELHNHEAARLSAINVERMKYIPQGGNWTDIPYELLPAGMKRARTSDHTKRYGRANPDGLACTILTKCDPHWGAYFHYEQDRTFTVREAARLQSFPDSFHFTGSKVEQYAQVGNAVPTMMAVAIGKSIAVMLGAGSQSQLPLAS